MASFINTNIASLNAQRNLTTSQSALATSLQRLSSGLRINSAKDDAAGLAISERFTAQIRGVNQATRNANDGISLAQTAEGALGAVGNNLQRIRELAVQSSNSTNTATDRAAIQKEVAQLQSEINRVASQTSFNGNKLLDGSFSGSAFQVGADAGQTITVSSITNSNTTALGTTAFATSAATNVATTDALVGVTINGNNGNGAILISDVTAATANTSTTTKANALASAINAQYDKTGVYATITGAAGAEQIQLASTTGGQGFTVSAGSTNAGVATTAVSATSDTVATLNTSTFVGAQRAITLSDAALTTVNSGRADLGAIQNRFSSAVSNSQSTSENLSAARSRIQDADFASETASLTRGQILQQAGTAILAQANSLPNGVLALLRG